MNAALAWMPVFPGDELAETAGLSCEEYGAYALLKLSLWQFGTLPDDDDRLCRITRLPLDHWLRMRPILEPLFGPGWRHEKLEQHRAQAETQRERKSAAGKKGAQRRWGDSNANASANGNRMAEPMAETWQPHSEAWQSHRSANASANANAMASTPTSTSTAYESKAPTHAHTRTREDDDFPFDPPETVEQGRRFLEDRGVKPEDIEAKLTKLMAFRLYPSEIAA